MHGWTEGNNMKKQSVKKESKVKGKERKGKEAITEWSIELEPWLVQ